MRRLLFAVSLSALLAACGGDEKGKNETTAATEAAARPGADSMASHDPGPGQPSDPASHEDQPRLVMRAQVVMERLGFSVGVVDDTIGLSTRNALSAFQEANGLPVTGDLDETTASILSRWSNIGATRIVTIPADFASGPFAPLPKDASQQAKLPAMGYASLDEKLAERFHTTVAMLRTLNPQITGPFAAGQQLRVPNVGADAIDPAQIDDAAWLATLASLGVGSMQPELARIVVSKGKGSLKGYDESGKLVAEFTVTTGSAHDPLPLGNWKILGISRNPQFHYNPDLFWDVPDSKGKELLPPGPNGPVGVVWIDLSKPHYGIHGTSEPETIGTAQSHGCVRLTNWDAARLAQMVSTRTKVEFAR
jgi:lipoprotein-anchoring transpeptidase ErfK/SrfK